jgi:uncharacterized protein
MQSGDMNTAPVTFISRARPNAEWPADLLRAEEIRRLRPQGRPMDEFIVKIHSRCNLACDYCYIYEMGDTTWKEQPPSMSMQVAARAADRIATHAEDHGLSRVFVILHGGEPLLVGAKRLEQLLMVFQTSLSYVTQPIFGMQTNGLLLTEEIGEVLHRFGVRVSVSLDGGKEANDQHRKRRNGKGSFDDVVQRLNDIRRTPYAAVIGGVLATIDLRNPPLATYEDLRQLRMPFMDFLLPHATWSNPPYRPEGAAASPYASWLIEIFDHWYKRPDQPEIRMFSQILRMLDGGTARTEMMGLEPVTLAVIETNGTYGLVDTMKSSKPGAAATSLDVKSHSLDDLLALPEVAARQLGEHALSATCRTCDVRKVCGAGYYPHRYKAGEGYRQPSVYCPDLYELINHISRRRAQA